MVKNDEDKHVEPIEGSLYSFKIELGLNQPDKRESFMISAIIFDFDGTIIDTETAWYYAYKDIYAEHGIDLPLEIWGQCIGTTFASFNPHTYLQESVSEVIVIDKIKAVAKEKYHNYMLNQTLRPGVKEYLETARRLELRLAIASSSTREWIDRYLDLLGIRSYFEYVISANDVSHVKPNPEFYLKAIEELKVEAKDTIAFEDSSNGLKAAKAANIYCVVVPNEVTKYMDFANYDLRIESMSEKKLEEIVNEANLKVAQ